MLVDDKRTDERIILLGFWELLKIKLTSESLSWSKMLKVLFKRKLFGNLCNYLKERKKLISSIFPVLHPQFKTGSRNCNKQKLLSKLSTYTYSTTLKFVLPLALLFLFFSTIHATYFISQLLTIQRNHFRKLNHHFLFMV